MKKDDKEKDNEEDTMEEETPAEDEGTEVQYLIKWLGYSHLHNTWETGRIVLSCHSVCVVLASCEYLL